MGLVEAYKFKGRKQVLANISLDDYMKDPIENTKKVLGSCLATHNFNVGEIKKLEEILVGIQDILKKTREDDTPFNNKIVENHLWRISEFKKGFNVGKPIEYSYKGQQSVDDMSYFNSYIQDSGKPSLDVELYGDVFDFGIGYRMLVSKRSDYDNEWESPFELFNIDVKDCFMTYENSVQKRQLFACIINNIYDPNDEKNVKKSYTIYLSNGYYFQLISEDRLKKSFNVSINLTKLTMNSCPIIEFVLNKQRFSYLEQGNNLQNALNGLDSLELDDIEQFVSSFLVFENQEIDDEFIDNLKKLKKQRALAVKSTNPQLPAKVSTLSQNLDYSQVEAIYGRFKSALYDITATPLGSGNVTSGGDTTGARLLGNGWETAQNQAEVDTSILVQSEYKQLRLMFEICRFADNNKLDKIYPSQIEIKYNINMSNNLLVKSQALQTLRSIEMPCETALNMVNITGDSYGVAKEWQRAIEEKQQREDELAKKQSEEKQVEATKVNTENTPKNQQE